MIKVVQKISGFWFPCTDNIDLHTPISFYIYNEVKGHENQYSTEEQTGTAKFYRKRNSRSGMSFPQNRLQVDLQDLMTEWGRPQSHKTTSNRLVWFQQRWLGVGLLESKILSLSPGSDLYWDQCHKGQLCKIVRLPAAFCRKYETVHTEYGKLWVDARTKEHNSVSPSVESKYVFCCSASQPWSSKSRHTFGKNTKPSSYFWWKWHTQKPETRNCVWPKVFLLNDPHRTRNCVWPKVCF